MPDMRRRPSRAILAVVLGLVLTATIAVPTAVAAPAAQTKTTITVKMTEFKFSLSKKTVKRGKVTFKVVNNGSIAHDFKIAGKKTKLLKPGQRAQLTVKFKKKGKFAYVCTVPGHSSAGMKGVLKVK